LTFSAGQTSKTVNVTVRGDVKFEPDEVFTVNLSNASMATIADGQGVGTFIDNDPYVLDYSEVLVPEGAGEAVFTVTLSQPSSQTVTVNYTTTEFIADSGADYSDVSGTLTFAPGETSKTVAVPIVSDAMYEGEEIFYLDLSGAVNAKLGIIRRNGQIQDDDPYPTVSINDVSVVEGNTGFVYAAFTVSLSNPTYQTVDLFWLTDNGTASWAFDYGYSSGSLSFSPGQSSKAILIPSTGDLEPGGRDQRHHPGRSSNAGIR
jgi:hypothetical protein